MRKPLRALALAVALGMAGMAVAPAAAAPSDKATVDRTAPAVAGAWVTLVTGDRVAVSDGRPRGIDPVRRAGKVQFAQYSERGDWYVVPSDAFQLINSGAVDRQLFNVTGLVRQGYDDAHTSVLPLLAEYPNVRAATAPAGARKGRVFTTLNLARLDERKADAARFWSTVAGGTSAKSLKAGPRKLWLNRKVKATLDQSVPQVGAPAAWQAGLTGKDVTVAVLDTGYDLDHPDLAGRIGPTQDFMNTGTVDDRYGHGTHVASITLGSGAASGGRYKGVAPEAKLAVGKVLDDTGSGTFESVLAGMEWASATIKARVVNMSLGAGPSDGTDIMSQAVNRLSRDNGTLFVISAGNFGEPGTIGTPGAADAALTVGSVTKSDELSDFSSRGPRMNNYAIKPDIAGPGSDIVAARATGTFPDEAVDENYAKLSGTSMAAPHVAGAAAILAQKYPSWSGEQLKAALMGSAKQLDGLGANEIGAGRLDVARAVSQQVVAVPGSVSTFLAWPHADIPPRQHTVTYRNSGTSPVTLALDLALTGEDGKPAPAGLATLSATSVTVPAGGEAVVTFTVKAVAGNIGNFVGALGATGGGAAIHTPVSVYLEPERYDLSFDVKDRNGAAAPNAQVLAINLDTGAIYGGSAGDTFRAGVGRYSAFTEVFTPVAGQDDSVTEVAHPEFRFTGPAKVALDARWGKPIRMSIDQPAANGGQRTVSHSMLTRADPRPFVYTSVHDPRFSAIYAASVPGVRSKSYAFHNWLHAEDPIVSMTAVAPESFPVMADWLDLPTPAMDVRLDAVHGGTGTVEDLAKVDARGKLVTMILSRDVDEAEFLRRIGNVKAAGGRLLLIEPRFDGAASAAWLKRLRATTRAAEPDEGLPMPTMFGFGVSTARFVALTSRPGAKAHVKTLSSQKYRYEIATHVRNAIPATLNFDTKTKDLAVVRSRYHAQPGTDAGHSQLPEITLGGEVVNPSFYFSVPSGVERTEYFTPGLWTHVNSRWGMSIHDLVAEKSRLRRGGKHTLEWNKAAFGPAFTEGYLDLSGQRTPWVRRANGEINVAVPLFSDAAGHVAVPYSKFEGETATTSLYRNGKLVGSTDEPGIGDFPVPAGAANYRLTATSKRDMPDWTLATDVSATWTFRSSRDGVLPLLTVGLDPRVNLVNTAPAGTPFAFPATVARQPGSGTAAVRSLTVAISNDDGKTWKPLRVVRSGAKWTVTGANPKSGFVSLRAKATDAQGNTVEQTVTRAYAVR